MNKAREKLLLLKIQRSQDAESFTELYQALVDPIYRFIYFKVNNQEIAQDLTSEVFLRGWRELTKKDGRQVKHLKSFLYTVARNIVIDYYRSSQRQVETQMTEEHLNIGVEGEGKQIEVKLEYEQLLIVVKRLKDSYQEVLVLKHIEEMSLVEISRVIKKSPVATRVLLHRANQAFKREYEKVIQNPEISA